MTLDNAKEVSRLLDEKECLEMASENLSDYLRIRVEISVDNPSPSSVWVREYTGEFMTKEVIRKMRDRIAEIEKTISKM